MINEVPGQHGDVGEAPGVGVEERHDDEAAVALADAEAVGVGAARAGSCCGASTRRPWGCRWCRRCSTSTRRRSRPGPRASRRSSGCPPMQLGVVVDALDVLDGLQRRAGLGVDRAVDDDVADLGQVGEQLGERRGEGVVDDDDLAAAVVRDVDELLGEEPDVEGVEHRPHRRHGEVGGEVLGVVPHERGDALVTGDAEAAEGVRQLGGLLPELGEAEPAARRRRSTSRPPGRRGGWSRSAGAARSTTVSSAWCSSWR